MKAELVLVYKVWTEKVEQRILSSERTKEILKNTCLNIKNTQGIILHNDLGSQYTNHTFESSLSCHKKRYRTSLKPNYKNMEALTIIRECLL